MGGGGAVGEGTDMWGRLDMVPNKCSSPCGSLLQIPTSNGFGAFRGEKGPLLICDRSVEGV